MEPPPLDPALVRRVVAAGWWPAGVGAQLESGGTARDRSLTGLGGDLNSGGQAHLGRGTGGVGSGSAASGAGVPGPDAAGAAGAPRAARASIAPPPQDAVALARVRALDAGIRELHTLGMELDSASGDYVRLRLVDTNRGLLRPFLLYLVERGVLRADEVDGFLAAETGDLLNRLRGRIAAAHDRRAGLEVQRYLLMQRLEAIAKTQDVRR